MNRSRLLLLQRRLLAVCTAAFLLTACSGGSSAPPSSIAPASTTTGGSSSATTASTRFLKSVTGSDSTPLTYRVSPKHVFFATAGATPAQFPTPSQCVAAFGLACYTPQLIRSAYNVPSSLDGTGQTIVIVDAFGSPTISTDLQIFDAEFGLPNPTLNIIYPVGQPPAFDPTNADMVSWAVETSLDVEWSHAIAPGATIDLLIAPTDVGNPLDQAQAYAVRHRLGNVMSLSFGTPEADISGFSANLQLLGSDLTYALAAATGMTVLASSGDLGASNGFATPDANYPASDPLVTAVGGTDLFMSDAGVYQSEYVWNDSVAAQCPFGCTSGIFGATGGAPSTIFAAPDYQQDLSHQRARTTSDVAYNASVYTSVLVCMTFLPPGCYFVGGTSEGAPQWAGIVSLANQAASRGQTVGFMNPKLYAIGANRSQYASDFHDITVGNNAFFGPGFSASPGYDLPTGLGTPNVANLIHDLNSREGRR